MSNAPEQDKKLQLDENHRQFAVSDCQLAAVDAYLQTGSCAAAARVVGRDRGATYRSLRAVQDNALRHNYSPQHGLSFPIPQTHTLGKVTYQIGANGEVERYWPRAELDREQLRKTAEAIAEGVFASRTPVLKQPKVKKRVNQSLSSYILADLHFGMYSDKDETGDEDWDCKKALRVYSDAFSRMLHTTPDSDTCLLVNLGDLLHMDDETNTTKRSGNVLDVDTRHWKVARLAGQFVRYAIDLALQKHAKVHYVNVKGNHDWTTADLLGMGVEYAYEKEPRVTVDNNPSAFHYYKHGAVLIGMTHGHFCKSQDLGSVMLDARRADVGQCEFCHWWTGHIHHETRKEYGWYVHESFRAPLPKDSYHARHGYRSRRDMVAIVHDPVDGEVERTKVVIRRSP